MRKEERIRKISDVVGLTDVEQARFYCNTISYLIVIIGQVDNLYNLRFIIINF